MKYDDIKSVPMDKADVQKIADGLQDKHTLLLTVFPTPNSAAMAIYKLLQHIAYLANMVVKQHDEITQLKDWVYGRLGSILYGEFPWPLGASPAASLLRDAREVENMRLRKENERLAKENYDLVLKSVGPLCRPFAWVKQEITDALQERIDRQAGTINDKNVEIKNLKADLAKADLRMNDARDALTCQRYNITRNFTN